MRLFRSFLAILVLLSCSCSFVSGYAQQFIWDAQLDGWFDNREYANGYNSQTIFGTRLNAIVGIVKDEHTLAIGGYWIDEFGSDTERSPVATLYYEYNKDDITATFGSFSRSLSKTELPHVFLDDSLAFFEPNICGFMMRKAYVGGFVEAYINWYGKQSEITKEAFRVVGSGQYEPVRSLIAGNITAWTHQAKDASEDSDDVKEKLMSYFYARYMPHIAWFDSIDVMSGCLLSACNDRALKSGWKLSVGWLNTIMLRKYWVEISDELYIGGPASRYYDSFGIETHRGEAFYRERFYNRADVSFYLLQRSKVKACVGASFRFTRHSAMHTSQFVKLCIDVN